MADDYTPTTAEVRERFIDGFPIDTWAVSRDQCGQDFDAWLAAHDAEKRAEWEAEQGEVEWEYAVQTRIHSIVPAYNRSVAESMVEHDLRYQSGRVVRRRKAGPWVPVNENGTAP